MRNRLFASSAAIALMAGTVASFAASHGGMVFNRVASFPVASNIPEGTDKASVSSAEIIAATQDGMMLVYSDSPLGGIGFVDITDPAKPVAAGFVAAEGEPTSVAVQNGRALVAVNTSENYVTPSGKLLSINLMTREVEQTCDLGGQPDSIAISPDGTMAAVAIENERDEELNDGVIPQMPAGSVVTFRIASGAVVCDSMVTADLTGLATVAPEDPEAEFVAINDANEVVVTLQENNHIAIIEGRTGKVLSHFSAGAVTLENVDTEEEGALTFDGKLENVLREPDAVKWLDNDRFVTANEGDYEGGSRGFTIFNKTGEVLFESGLDLEHRIALAGHYPEGRSGNKGAEPEGLEVATFGDTKFIFVLSERASVIGVYKDTGAAPEFVQLLPSGLSPEGAVAIASRGLLAIANEVDLVEDGGVRSHVTLYQLGDGPAAYPTIVSQMQDGRPLGWGALSGAVADATQPGILYAVNDSVYKGQPTIFTIDANQTPALITAATRVTRGGNPLPLADFEGITLDGEGGFWLASEGRADRGIAHRLVRVDAAGAVTADISFPSSLLTVQERFGAEGVAKIGDTLWVAIQREWKDDEKGFVKLVSYNIATKEWGAVRYPLEAKGEGWNGLSETTLSGEHVYIVERDNQIGAAAVLKKVFRVPVADLKPAALGGELPVVTKEEVLDLMPMLQSQGGYVLDKVESLAVDAAGNWFAITDNDGVDDSNGETQFMRLGAMVK